MGVVAVIVGILAILCALLATFALGTTGGIIAGVLGVAAIVLGFMKRKKDGKGGVSAVVIGVLSIILAFSLTSVWSAMFTELHNKAVTLKPDGLWAKVSENTSGGMMGLINNLPTDEATLNALVDEMNELNSLMEPQTATATEAPAATDAPAETATEAPAEGQAQ